MREKKPFHEVVATRLIEQLKQGTAPWLKPWSPGEPRARLPHNPLTGKRYKGINALHLLAQERADTRWMTYRQAQTLGGQIRKGERGTPIQYWKFTEEEERLGADGKPVLDAQGQSTKVTVQLERPRVFFATVFNAEQVGGLPPPAVREPPTWTPHERAESLLSASGARLRHEDGERAFYRLSTDTIHLPSKGQFETADRYYATALHELGHWTGHPTRLERDLANPFGSEAYAKEELRAEIASMLMGDELGIGHDPGQHVAYIGSWIKILEADSLELFRAAAAAEKICDYVLTCELQLKAERGVEKAEEWHEGAPRDQASGWGARLADSAPGGRELREAKQAADLAAVLDDPDIQRRVAELERRERDAAASLERTYLSVPFAEKDDAKGLGARWDRARRAWYVPEGLDPAGFTRWAHSASEGTERPRTVSAPGGSTPEAAEARRYLAVPYVERAAARAAGALWDRSGKSWYIGPKADLEVLTRWAPTSVDAQQGPAMAPREEFATALLQAGCEVSEPHPIMDGQRHRIRAEGDAKGELAGFYVGHLDGHPAGYIKNNRTGVELKWKSKGYFLQAEERRALHEASRVKLRARAAEQSARHEATAQRLASRFAELHPVQMPIGYLRQRGIQAHPGIATDKDGQTLHVPAYDAHGKQWTTQYIQEDGAKRFAKNSRKEGCFHPIGGMQKLASASVVLIAEGYATAASIVEATGFMAVAAFDCGNLKPVAEVLRQKYPDKTILIAGDNDVEAEARRGINPGRKGAEAAALAIGTRAIFPTFAPEERATSARPLTDFNDLAQHSTLGEAGVRRQISAAIDECLARAPRANQNTRQKVQSRAIA